MKVLDLFSGIGGFSLGLERAGMETIAFCEIDKFCQKVLNKHWPNVPIHDDITKLDGKQYAGTIDIICGGFPCQPFSVAGKQKGKDDNRYLWPEMFRIISQAKPTWVIGENVPGIINMALEQVSSDLESEGYQVQTLIIPACAVNAPHRRSRTWILAYTEHAGRNASTQQRGDGAAICNSTKRAYKAGEFKRICASALMANAEGQGLERQNRSKSKLSQFARFSRWKTQPTICGGDDGIPYRMERIKALGNAIVPQIPEILGKIIMQIESRS